MRVENNLGISRSNRDLRSDAFKIKATNPMKENEVSKIVSKYNPATLAAYNGVSFGSKFYDKTNFREDLEARAQVLQEQFTVNGEPKELYMYKTKHSDYVVNSDNDKLYKLRYCDNPKRVAHQVIASKIYNLYGIRTPEYVPFEKDGKTGYMVEVLEEKLQPA